MQLKKHDIYLFISKIESMDGEKGGGGDKKNKDGP